MQRERSRSHAFFHRNRSSSLESIDSKLLTTTIQLSPNKTDRRDRIRDGTMLKKSTDAQTYGENNQRSATKSLNQNSSDLDYCTGNRRSDDHLFNHLSYQSNRNQSNSRKFKNEITISQSDRHFQSSSILSSLKNQPQQQHHNTSNRSIQTAARAIPPSWGLTQQEILIRNTEQLSLIENENYTERTAAADEGSSKQKVQPKPVALFRMVANIKMQAIKFWHRVTGRHADKEEYTAEDTAGDTEIMRSGRGRGRGRGRGGMQKIPDLIQQADNEMDTVLFEADDSFEASPSPKRLRGDSAETLSSPTTQTSPIAATENVSTKRLSNFAQIQLNADESIRCLEVRGEAMVNKSGKSTAEKKRDWDSFNKVFGEFYQPSEKTGQRGIAVIKITHFVKCRFCGADIPRNSRRMAIHIKTKHFDECTTDGRKAAKWLSEETPEFESKHEKIKKMSKISNTKSRQTPEGAEKWKAYDKARSIKHQNQLLLETVGLGKGDEEVSSSADVDKENASIPRSSTKPQSIDQLFGPVNRAGLTDGELKMVSMFDPVDEQPVLNGFEEMMQYASEKLSKMKPQEAKTFLKASPVGRFIDGNFKAATRFGQECCRADKAECYFNVVGPIAKIKTMSQLANHTLYVGKNTAVLTRVDLYRRNSERALLTKNVLGSKKFNAQTPTFKGKGMTQHRLKSTRTFAALVRGGEEIVMVNNATGIHNQGAEFCEEVILYMFDRGQLKTSPGCKWNIHLENREFVVQPFVAEFFDAITGFRVTFRYQVVIWMFAMSLVNLQLMNSKERKRRTINFESLPVAQSVGAQLTSKGVLVPGGGRKPGGNLSLSPSDMTDEQRCDLAAEKKALYSSQSPNTNKAWRKRISTKGFTPDRQLKKKKLEIFFEKSLL